LSFQLFKSALPILEKDLGVEFCLEISLHLSLMHHARKPLAGHHSVHVSMSVSVELLPFGFQFWLFQVANPSQ
jgi:hypothetical protein